MQSSHEPAPEDPTLARLMAAYQAGRVDAFDGLYAALAADLKTYLTMLTRDPARADDLLQETFLQIHRARAAHTPGRPVRPWVFAIAKRVFLMDRRSASRRARREVLPSTEEGAAALDATAAATGLAESETERLHARRQVESVLGQVPADRRRAFLLHHLLGFSFKEIGDRLGIKPGAAKIRSSRAASLMRALLGEPRDD